MSECTHCSIDLIASLYTVHLDLSAKNFERYDASMPRRSISIRLASAVLSFSGMVLLFCGFTIVRHEQRQVETPFLVPEDTGNFLLKFHRQCLATIKTQVKKDDAGTAILLDVATIPHDATEPLDIKGEFSFNEFNQLFGSQMSFANQGQMLNMNTVGIHPIIGKLRGRLFEYPFAFEYSLPGPVIIRKEAHGFRILTPRSTDAFQGAAPEVQGITVQPYAEHTYPTECPDTANELPSIAPESIIKLLNQLKSRSS